jgi:predicted TIM-barrel fold metal-dependent hydrolase
VQHVDIHQHFWPEAFIEALGRRNAPPRLHDGVLELAEGVYRVDLANHDPARRVAELDAQGIDVAVLSLQPTLGFEALPVEEVDELTALWHTGTLEVVAASGGRFAVLASGRVLRGCVGAVVPGFALRDIDALSPLLAELTAGGGFLLVHPSGGAPPPGAPEWWPGIVDYSSEMQAAYFTWLSYAQPLWSSVNVIFAILAGGGPFQLERLASRGLDVRSALHRNVYFDTASYGRRALELCIETFGVHQLVYGSDVPVVDPMPTLNAVRGFGESVVQLITADNPSRLLS